jgi:hypothetical protein
MMIIVATGVFTSFRRGPKSTVLENPQSGHGAEQKKRAVPEAQ